MPSFIAHGEEPKCRSLSAAASPRNFNHPKKGSSIKVEPIKDLKVVKRIKKRLESKPRDLCLFTLGINTAYRANELLSLTVGQVDYLMPGDRLDLKQRKTSTYRAITVNGAAVSAIDNWLKVYKPSDPSLPLFPSQKGGQALTVSAVHRMVKGWCADAGLRGNFGSHTLRKTWGFHQRQTFGKRTAVLTQAYGHASERQTLDYLCIQPEEIDDLYASEL